jgi:peptidoglycan/xylan/chitin deacetylase (PgdA/CDA1 family)
MGQKVIPFHIAIGPRGSNGAYEVQATTKCAETTTEHELPEELLALAGRLLQPGVKLPIGDAPALGRALGRALLAPPLRDMLLRSARGAVQENERLQVQLQIVAPELAALPWEWITLGVSRPWSPALREDYALVRIGRRAPTPAPVSLAGPLRILVAASAGEELQLEALHSALAPAIQAGHIELHLLRRATSQTLERALASDSPHILHCAAPIGATRNGVAQVLLGNGLAACDMAALAAASPDLRLITLAGPQGDASSVSAMPPLLATTMLGGELPAAIAFGAALPAGLTARFAAACYTRLAEGQAVDLAVTAGRRALSAHANGRGWGFPQLRLLPGGEQIFLPPRTRRSRSATARTRRPRLGAGPVPRWALIATAMTLLIAMLLVGRSLTARSISRDAAIVAPQIERGNLQPSPTFGGESAETPNLPAATPELLLSSNMPTATVPSAAEQPLLGEAPTGYATVLTVAGDTFEGIAGRMGSDAAAIAALNRLDPLAPLRPDRPLVIPIFRPGEGGAGGLIIDHGNRAKPQVALTFDIEIDDATLYGILDILRARGMHGTFFLTGSWVQAYPDAARAIVRDGHEIANHSFSHPYFSRIGLDGAAAELEATEKIIKETTGLTSHPYFRFPYGDSTPNVAGVVAKQGYVAYHWSADDAAISYWLDTTSANPSSGNGAILLMHGRYSTVQSLPGWIDRLVSMGLQPATLGEVLK